MRLHLSKCQRLQSIWPARCCFKLRMVLSQNLWFKHLQTLGKFVSQFYGFLYPCFISVLPSYSFYILLQSEAAKKCNRTEWVDVSWENSKTLPGWRHAQFPWSIYWTYKKDYSMDKNSPASLPFLHSVSGHTFHIKIKYLLLLFDSFL